MNLNSDSIFCIGSSHKVCEDFSKHSISKNSIHSVLVSDGCSGSTSTDTGSRVITQVATDKLDYIFGKYSDFASNIINSARFCLEKYLNLPNQALDATLFCVAINNGKFNYYDYINNETINYVISGYGDGSIIKIRKDNTIEFIYIEYPSGAPLYMNYYNDQLRFEYYKNEFGLQRKIYKYTIINNIITDFKLDIDDNGETYYECGIAENYKFLGVTSDGIASFVDSNNKLVEMTSIVKALVDFKSYKGEFIQRRMNGFNKFCVDNGWKHNDDFSFA